MSNGIRKTTARFRNVDVIRRLLDTETLRFSRPIRVLDIGASAGVDALGIYQLLSQRVKVDRYVLADYYTHVIYEPTRRLIFDEDRTLIQVDRGSSFVSIHFAYNYKIQSLVCFWKRWLPAMLQRKYRFDPTAELVQIPLIAPEIKLDGAPFSFRRMNVFKPISDSYDLIICMHLLVERYFSPSEIQRGIDNLSKALANDGRLVLGSAEKFRVITPTMTDLVLDLR